ncbi:MAG: HTH domain-containing protein, partial [Burkholderiales bacterium]|nr:HTH domain-containing protein [Burkholderiales bacterium]
MNPLTLATLRLLDDGTSRSGEAIAHALGVTRATVWNAIRDAERHGVEIEKVRGLGYRLATAPVWLDAERIASALGVRATDFRI